MSAQFWMLKEILKVMAFCTFESGIQSYEQTCCYRHLSILTLLIIRGITVFVVKILSTKKRKKKRKEKNKHNYGKIAKTRKI